MSIVNATNFMFSSGTYNCLPLPTVKTHSSPFKNKTGHLMEFTTYMHMQYKLINDKLHYLICT